MSSAIKTLLMSAGLLWSQLSLAADPSVVLRGIPHQALFDASFDGSHGYAVGAGGQIVESLDGGKTWKPDATPNGLSLLGVAVSGDRAIAVGQMGLILVKQGKGAWTPVKVETQERLLDVALNRAGFAVIVGSFGTVLRSTDGGQSWSQASPDWPAMFEAESATLGDSFHPHLYGVSVSETSEVTIAGELSVIMTSKGANEPWRITHRGLSEGGAMAPSIFNLDVREDGVGFAVGQSGLILKTRDGGRSWARIDSGTEAILLSVVSGNDRHTVISGMREMLASSDDENFKRVSGGDLATAWYSALVKPEGSPSLLAVGQSGTILSLAR